METGHRIFCLVGKSATGKDTIYRRLMEDASLPLRRVVPYTTRPKRAGEAEGREYRFRSPEAFETARSEGRIIEYRRYDTVCGPWYYYTMDDGQIDLAAGSYLCEGPLGFFINLKAYYGEERVLPVYIRVEDGERLLRAIAREKREEHPRYAEVCRRYLADEEDFAREKLRAAGIEEAFENRDLDTCVDRIRAYIRRQIQD